MLVSSSLLNIAGNHILFRCLVLEKFSEGVNYASTLPHTIEDRLIGLGRLNCMCLKITLWGCNMGLYVHVNKADLRRTAFMLNEPPRHLVHSIPAVSCLEPGH
jgi:hypothetical protein